MQSLVPSSGSAETQRFAGGLPSQEKHGRHLCDQPEAGIQLGHLQGDLPGVSLRSFTSRGHRLYIVQTLTHHLML